MDNVTYTFGALAATLGAAYLLGSERPPAVVAAAATVGIVGVGLARPEGLCVGAVLMVLEVAKGLVTRNRALLGSAIAGGAALGAYMAAHVAIYGRVFPNSIYLKAPETRPTAKSRKK